MLGEGVVVVSLSQSEPPQGGTCRLGQPWAGGCRCLCMCARMCVIPGRHCAGTERCFLTLRASDAAHVRACV